MPDLRPVRKKSLSSLDISEADIKELDGTATFGQLRKLNTEIESLWRFFTL